MGLVVVPIGIGGLGDVDVCRFTYCVLAGVCASDLDVEGIAAVATGDDDGLLSELAERRKLILCRHESFLYHFRIEHHAYRWWLLLSTDWCD